MVDDEKPWVEYARELLLPYRNRDVEKSITLSGKQADKLVEAIAELLVDVYLDGYSAGGTDATLDDRTAC